MEIGRGWRLAAVQAFIPQANLIYLNLFFQLRKIRWATAWASSNETYPHENGVVRVRHNAVIIIISEKDVYAVGLDIIILSKYIHI